MREDLGDYRPQWCRRRKEEEGSGIEAASSVLGLLWSSRRQRRAAPLPKRRACARERKRERARTRATKFLHNEVTQIRSPTGGIGCNVDVVVAQPFAARISSFQPVPLPLSLSCFSFAPFFLVSPVTLLSVEKRPKRERREKEGGSGSTCFRRFDRRAVVSTSIII